MSKTTKRMPEKPNSLNQRKVMRESWWNRGSQRMRGMKGTSLMIRKIERLRKKLSTMFLLQIRARNNE